jgi:MFS family permease
LNGVGFNVGRAAGPALGGLVIAALGIAVPFWIFAASNAVIVAALVWWRKPQKAAESLPAERLVSAVRAGVRHAANNQYLRATLMRVLAFFPFASAYLALLPLLAASDFWGTARLRHSSGCDRRRRCRGVAGAAMAEGRTRSGPPRSRGIGRCRIRARPVRARARAYYGDLRMSSRRRVMDRGDN